MTNLGTTIDSFGDLKAEIADAELKLQAMKDALAELEKGSYEGERYRLNVVVSLKPDPLTSCHATNCS